MIVNQLDSITIQNQFILHIIGCFLLFYIHFMQKPLHL